MGSHKRNWRDKARSRVGRRQRATKEFTQIPMGTNRFRVQVIAEACLAEGLRVQTLLTDDSGYGNVEPHRLLVRVDQLEQVLAVIEKSDKG